MPWPFPAARRSPRGRYRPRVARLEPRTMLSVTIQFNYSDDANDFFNTQAKKDLLQAAANLITSELGNTLSAIVPGGGNTWSPFTFNPSNPSQNINLSNPTIPANTIVIYVGGSALGGPESGLGGFGGFSNGMGSQAWINTLSSRGQSGSPFAPWGGSIAFDDSGNTSWYFGTDASGLQANQTDFFTVAEHEIGHVLGIGTSPQWTALVSGGFFVGPHAEAAFGNEPVPVDPGHGHFAEGTMSGGQVAVMTPVLPDGTRRVFTPLDVAALEDLGWQVQVQGKSTTTTAAGPSTYTPVRGQTMTLYAVVSASAGGTPTGTVSYMLGSTLWAVEPLVTSGSQTVAAMPTAPMPLGTYTVTTIYSGDANHQSSQSSMTFTVGKDATTTVVAPSDFAPVFGESLAINVLVSVNAPGAGAPTGRVTFTFGGKALATEPVLSANGLFFARLPAVPFGLGTYTFGAVYNGDSGDVSSQGFTTFAVGKDATTTIAGPSNFAPVVGQPLAVNAIVAVKSPGAGTPTGTVTFRFGATTSWVEPLRTVNGLTFASLPLAPLGAGTYTFTAVYNGDALDLTSSGSTTFRITAAGPALAARAAASPMLLASLPPPGPMAAAAVARSASPPAGAWLAAIDALAAARWTGREE